MTFENESVQDLAGLLARGIGLTQGLYLHWRTQHRKMRTNIHALNGIRTTISASKRWRFTPQTEWPLRPVEKVLQITDFVELSYCQLLKKKLCFIELDISRLIDRNWLHSAAAIFNCPSEVWSNLVVFHLIYLKLLEYLRITRMFCMFILVKILSNM